MCSIRVKSEVLDRFTLQHCSITDDNAQLYYVNIVIWRLILGIKNIIWCLYKPVTAILKFNRQNHFINTEFSIDVDPTGADALNVVKSRVSQRNTISLAIIDIVLPKRDGLQLAKELNTLTDIGVILLSSRDSQADRIAGLAQGADDYILRFCFKRFAPRTSGSAGPAWPQVLS